jgi:hypothetical protein
MGNFRRVVTRRVPPSKIPPVLYYSYGRSGGRKYIFGRKIGFISRNSKYISRNKYKKKIAYILCITKSNLLKEPNNPGIPDKKSLNISPGKQIKLSTQLRHGMSSATKSFVKWWQMRVKINLSLYSLNRDWGIQEVEAPKISNQNIKVTRLTA